LSFLPPRRGRSDEPLLLVREGDQSLHPTTFKRSL
jgi:hypothetical protein